MPRLCAVLAFLATLALAPLGPLAFAKDDLVIGAAQFPSSLHPFIDAEGYKGLCARLCPPPGRRRGRSTEARLHAVRRGADDRRTVWRAIEDRPNGGKGIGGDHPAPTRPQMGGRRAGDHEGCGIHLAPGPRSRTPASAIFSVGTGRPGRGHRRPHGDHAVGQRSVLPILGCHYPRTHRGAGVCQGRGSGGYINQTIYNRAPTTAGLYDGPYMITGYNSGDQIILEANPHWPGTKPGFKRIAIRLIGNSAALQANLLSGDVDTMAGEGLGLTIDQVVALKERYPDRFVYIFKPSPLYEHLDLQKNNPILNDLRVRRALLMALDRKTLVEKLFAGLQPVAASCSHRRTRTTTPTFQPTTTISGRPGLAGRGGMDARCRRHLPQRRQRESVVATDHNDRQSAARIAEQLLQSQWKAACVEARSRTSRRARCSARQ